MKNSLGRLTALVVLTLAVVTITITVVGTKGRAALADTDHWASAQLISPEDLVQELAGPTKPIVIAVTFKQLYDHAHVPGALYFGPGQNSNALADLKDWAENQPRDEQIVLYCGCCPWQNCPNIRPAFNVLKDLGFTKLQVVKIDNDFTREWCNRKYPVEASN